MSRYLSSRALPRPVFVLPWGFVVLWIVGVGHLSVADGVDPEESKVERALEHARVAARLDMDGDRVHREHLLAAALREDPDCALARWQLGFIRRDDDWVSVRDHYSAAPPDDRYEDYHSRRDLSLDRAHNEIQLAAWCREHQLGELASLHYQRVVDNADNPLEMRRTVAKKLGLRSVNNTWMTQAEIDEYRVMLRRAELDLREWSGRVSKWAHDLRRPQSAKAARALEQLREIRSPAAIPALELVFSNADE